MSPGSAEAHSGDAGSVSAFIKLFPVAWGGLGSSLFIPHLVLWLGGLKGQETRGWFLTTCMFWHFMWLWHEQSVVAS